MEAHIRVAKASSTLLVAVALACSAGDDPADSARRVDCEWIESQNCWRDMVDAVRDCAPDPAASGQMSDDRRTCSYEDGDEIRFQDPVPADIDDVDAWRFELVTAGEPCLSWEDDPEAVAMEVTSDAGTITVEAVGDEYLLTCPDDSRALIDDLIGLYQTCPAAEGGLPLLTTQWNPSGFGIELGDEVDGEVDVFWCE